jgi:expansin (peptidoglycan-binding protein)
MTTKINEFNIQPAELVLIGSMPKISSVVVTNSSYVATGGTTIPTSGGYVKITGTGFVNGAQVLVDETLAAAVSFISATQLNVQIGAKIAGTYFVYVTNPDGGVGIAVNAVTVV